MEVELEELSDTIQLVLCAWDDERGEWVVVVPGNFNPRQVVDPAGDQLDVMAAMRSQLHRGVQLLRAKWLHRSSEVVDSDAAGERTP